MMALELDYKRSQLLIVNSYWPVAHDLKSGLHVKLARWLALARPGSDCSPLEFIKDGIQNYIYDFLKARGETGNIVLCGDLNSTVSLFDLGGHSNPPLQEWLDLSGLQDPIGRFLAANPDRG
jgi:hypothetical protein